MFHLFGQQFCIKDNLVNSILGYANEVGFTKLVLVTACQATIPLLTAAQPIFYTAKHRNFTRTTHDP